MGYSDMGEINWYKHAQYLPDAVKELTEAEAAYALREAWYRIYGQYPNDKSLAVLWAKSCLETGRWKFIHNYNFGNIKAKNDDKYFTMFTCGEEVSLSQANTLVREDPERVKILRKYKWSNGSKRASIEIKDGHTWSKFRAYLSMEDGAEDYLRFVSQNKRYIKAWQKVIEGDPEGYSHELKQAGYYTGNEKRYTAGVVRLFNEFLKNKEELMSLTGEIHDTDPSPPPVSDPELEIVEDIHDTYKDLEPPFPREGDDIPVTDEEPSSEIPTNRPVQNKAGTIAILAGIGAMIAWLLQGC